MHRNESICRKVNLFIPNLKISGQITIFVYWDSSADHPLFNRHCTMKFLRRIVVCLLTLWVTLSACSSGGNHKVASTGRAFEVLVVTPASVWESPVGDTLRAVLLEPVPMLNQREPLMDPIPLAPQAFTSVMERHRNVLEIAIGPDYPQPAMEMEQDVYAAPQLIVHISGPNDSIVTNYIWEHRTDLQQIFAIAERDRFVSYATSQTETRIQETIRQKFGFDLSLPKGYTIRNDLPDFLWTSFELPLVSQGVVIYSYPYTNQNTFSLDSLINRRNQFTALIPGPADGSYMSTVSEIEPEIHYRRIQGRLWAEMRGFWYVEGDFMGGPFVSFSTLDAATGRVICIDGYVFSPKHHKRNYVRELENLIYTARFPGEAPAEVPADTSPAEVSGDTTLAE